MTGHARFGFTEEMRGLEHDLLEMGARAERMVQYSLDSLTRLDPSLARQVLELDDEVDRAELSIESRCLRLFALQQPAGSDLRSVSTVMKMITDIERIGDLSVDIAKITLKIEKEFGDASAIDVIRMGNSARLMIRASLQAFVSRDLSLLGQVVDEEDRVDEMYRELRTQIFHDMRENPDQVVIDGWLMLAIHHVERIADHALNIAERVHFMITGEMRHLVEHHRADAELSN